MTYPNTQLFIAGQWQDAAEGKTLAVSTPATGKEIGRVAHATKVDLDRALDAAQKGFEAWRDIPAAERAKTMRRAAALMRERAPAPWSRAQPQGHADGAEGPGGPGGGLHAVELPHQPGGAQAGRRAGCRLLHPGEGARRNSRQPGRADPRICRCGRTHGHRRPGVRRPG